MEEPLGAQYAILVVVQTLKERCKSLQQRVSTLEEENLTLRKQCKSEEETNNSLCELDKLRGQVMELNERKQQMQNKVKLVMNENQELWCKLGKLTQVNQNLDNHLNKINDSIIQYTEKSTHSPLIRSRTFTQDEPHTKVLQKNMEESNKITTELEEISLKILNSLAQGKSELDSLYNEISTVQRNDTIITESFGCYYDDFDNNIIEDFDLMLKELKDTKEVVAQQNSALHLALDKIKHLQELKAQICDKNKKEMVDGSTQSDVIEEAVSNVDRINSPDSIYYEVPDDHEKICPMCCQNFSNVQDFTIYQNHVEQHFVAETYEML